MENRFKNSRDRTKRATHHAGAFACEWDALMGGGDEAMRSELRQDEAAGWWAVFAWLAPKVQDRVDTNTLALELGEFAYQLRAALDGLMWDAITYIQRTEPPTDAANRLEFPILNGKNRDFTQCGLHKFPFPQKLVAWLESIQPDSAEKLVGDPDRGLKTTLEDIHDLARMDRHRRLRVIAAVPQSFSVMPDTTPPGGRIVAGEWFTEDLFSGEKKLARFKIECAGGLIPYQVYLKAKVSFQITVENIEMYDGEHVGAQLRRFVQAVDRVIDRFEAEIS